MANYDALKAYKGPKTQCDYCEKKFSLGQMISRCVNQDLVFCYSDSDMDGACLSRYVFDRMELPELLVVNPMVYRLRLQPAVVQIPPTAARTPLMPTENLGWRRLWRRFLSH